MPIWRLEEKIKEIILNAATENEGQKRGQAYIFGDPTDEAGYFKLGKSEKPMKREKAHQYNCKPAFEVAEVVPRAYPIPWFSRLESLAHAELTNTKYMFPCRCYKSHREYFIGEVDQALEILHCWSSWLQRDPPPYDEDLQLSPFWTDRLRLLGDDAFSHPRCPNTECHSSDIRSSTCQACLRLRLKAWTEVTDFDEFEYECRTRVGWMFLRRVMHWAWPRFGDHLLVIIDGWEMIKLVASIFWAPTTHFHFLLVLMVWLWCRSNLHRESLVYLIISCFFPYWRIKNGLADTLRDSQLTKVQTSPLARREIGPRKASNSPEPKTLAEIVSEAETPNEQESPSKRRSVSVDKSIDIPRIPQDNESASAACETSEAPTAEHNTPEPFLTPDRATTAPRRSPRLSAKRPKSYVY
jgi:hypothetical protein